MSKVNGFVVKYYDNIHPTSTPATNYCVFCGEEFTTENPCWNSDGSADWMPDDVTMYVKIHVDGECKNCATQVQSKIKIFESARADFYDAAVTLLNAWQDAESASGEQMFERNYPFTEDFAEVVYKIGRWSTDDPHDFESQCEDDWNNMIDSDKYPEEGEPTID